MLTRNYSPWQAHLERICDFLLAGEGIWWRTCNDGDIESFIPRETLRQFLKDHFCIIFTPATSKEETYLKCCWQTCLEKKIKMPIKVLQVENHEGNMVFVVDNWDAVVASCDDMGASCAAVDDSNAMAGCVDI